MIPDIFSSFDPTIFTSFIPFTSLLLIVSLIAILVLSLNISPLFNRVTSTLARSNSIIHSQLIRTQSKSLKGLPEIVTALFLLILLTNLIGLIPYTFSLSRQLIITLSFGLPIWLRIIISRFSYSPKRSAAHFLPDGAPEWLNPFLVLIETSRILVRPLTLSFRLAANITAGHIVLGLVGIYLARGIISSIATTLSLTLFSAFYILFEVAICMIQAYIFCLLISLYRDDHST